MTSSVVVELILLASSTGYFLYRWRKEWRAHWNTRFSLMRWAPSEADIKIADAIMRMHAQRGGQGVLSFVLKVDYVSVCIDDAEFFRLPKRLSGGVRCAIDRHYNNE